MTLQIAPFSTTGSLPTNKLSSATTTTLTTRPRLTRTPLLKTLSHVLEALCKTNTPNFPPPSPNHSTSIFYSIYPPTISLSTYIHRILRQASCSNSAIIIALVYLDRLQKRKGRDEPVMITFLNVHRLFLACLVVASKYVDDICPNDSSSSFLPHPQQRILNRNNSRRKGSLDDEEECQMGPMAKNKKEKMDLKYWTRVGGLSTIEEIKRLELGILKELEWKLYVDIATYKVYEKSLLSEMEELKREEVMEEGGGKLIGKLGEYVLVKESKVESFEELEFDEGKKKFEDRKEEKIMVRDLKRDMFGAYSTQVKSMMSRSWSLDDARISSRKRWELHPWALRPATRCFAHQLSAA